MTHLSRPLVTIGICTYNRADSYLREALQSAVDQTYPNLEIIVSDNCSVDHTEELVRGFQDPRIRYIRHDENIGLTNNFNSCARAARGAYFLLLCDDDLIDPDFVEACMDAAEDRTDFGLIRTGMRRIDGEGRVIKEQPNRAVGLSTKEFFRAWFRGGETPMHLCSTLFNTPGLLAVGGFQSETHLFCDVVPEVHLAAKYERLDIEAVKASFRIHDLKNSAFGRVKDWCVDSQYLFEVILDSVEDPDPEFRASGSRFFALHCLAYAGAVPSFSDRMTAYRLVHDSFDHTGPLFLEVFVTRPTRSFLKRGMRRLKARVGG